SPHPVRWPDKSLAGAESRVRRATPRRSAARDDPDPRALRRRGAVSIEEAQAVPYRYVPAACVLSLLGAFGVDLLTPQLFVAAILLDIPIVLSSLGSSARFRLGLIVAAPACDIIAGYVNGLQAAHHWSAIAIGDRLLAALSIVC